MIAVYTFRDSAPYAVHIIDVKSSIEKDFLEAVVEQEYPIPSCGTEIVFIENENVVAQYHLASDYLKKPPLIGM